MYTQWSSVHAEVGAAKDKMCLCNKSWQEGKIIPYSENIFLSPLSLSLPFWKKNPEIKPAFFIFSPSKILLTWGMWAWSYL